VLLRRAVGSRERRDATGSAAFGNSTPPSNGSLGSPAAGTVVNERTALQVAAVYGSVGVLSDALSTLPMNLMSSTDPASRRKLQQSPLLTQPYSEISRIDWLVEYTISLALRGNFFGHIVSRDEDFYPTQIKPIHPDHARVRRSQDGTVQYQFYGTTVPTKDVFHIRYLSVADSLIGLNPIEYLRNTLGLARAAEMYGGAFFANSALPGIVIEVEGDLDPDETLALAKQWQAMHQGITQAHLPAVLTDGAKANAISITPDDAQFLATREFSQSEISGMIFRVPPHMIGIVDRSTSWGTGIEQQELGFTRNTLGGYTRRLEEAFTALHPPGQYVRFDYNERLRGDKLSRYQAYSLGMLGGWLCADDVRAAEDEPPIPNGQGKNFMVAVNSELLAQALQDLKTSKNPPPPPAVITPPVDDKPDPSQASGGNRG
jgi:HK97 family phage portal protein